MINLTELEAHARELSIAIQSFVTHCQNVEPTLYSTNGDPPLHIHLEAQEEARRARDSALASVLKIQTILAGPTDFLQQMVIQVYTSFFLSFPAKAIFKFYITMN